MLMQQVEPNRHALPAALKLLPGRAEVRGYQCFKVIARHGAPGLPVPDSDDAKLISKRHLLSRYFQPRIMRHRSLLDIGGNAGFFSLWGASAGLARADSIDVDPQYTQLCTDVARHLGTTAVHAHTTNLTDWDRPADIVLAFAMVHWLYSATTGLSSLEQVVQLLASRTKALLLVEWVAPTDSAIQFLGHTQINRRDSAGPYSYSLFRSELERHFAVVKDIGRVSSTRTLLACWKDNRQRTLDLSWAEPPLMEPAKIWSARCVATDPDGAHLWSRVYDGGDRVIKQASYRLARSEADCLTTLANEPGFPRLLAYSQPSTATGIVEMEKVTGDHALQHATLLRTDHAAAITFFRGLLEILITLRKHAILHRDLRPANLLVRNGRPVLIDFGWASRLHEHPHPTDFVPPALGEGYRPPGRDFDDAWSAGKLLLELLGSAHPHLSSVAAAMASTDPSGRLKPQSALELIARL